MMRCREIGVRHTREKIHPEDLVRRVYGEIVLDSECDSHLDRMQETPSGL